MNVIFELKKTFVMSVRVIFDKKIVSRTNLEVTALILDISFAHFNRKTHSN